MTLPKKSEGSVVLELPECIPWPPHSDFEISLPMQEQKKGIFFLLRADGRISVAIDREGLDSFQLLSPLIIRPDFTPLKFGARWNRSDASLAVAGRIVAASDDQCSQEPVSIDVGRWEPDLSLQATIEQTATVTKEKRTLRERGMQARSGERLRSLEENLEILSRRTQALRDMADAAANGRDHHLYAISAALRLLICKGGSNMHPLLQRVAGLLDKALPIYALPPTVHDQSLVANVRPTVSDYSFVRCEAGRGLYKTDLDDWLDAPGFWFRNTLSSNNNLLRLFADKDGSHHDPSVTPELDFWNDILTSHGGYKKEVLLRTAAMTIKLAEDML